MEKSTPLLLYNIIYNIYSYKCYYYKYCIGVSKNNLKKYKKGIDIYILLCYYIIKLREQDKMKQNRKQVKENKEMTIKQEYEYMKSELRVWNNRSNWDDTKYCYHIER